MHLVPRRFDHVDEGLVFHDFLQGIPELVNHRLWRLQRRHQANPPVVLGIDSQLFRRGDIGGGLEPRCPDDGKGFQLVPPDQGQGVGGIIDVEIDVFPHHRRQCGTAAAGRDMAKLQARRPGKNLRGQVAHPVEAAGAEGHLARPCLRIGDEVGQILVGGVGRNDKQRGAHRESADGDKIVPGERRFPAVDNLPLQGIGNIDRPNRQRVAVRCGLCARRPSQHPGGARFVHDDDRLPQNLVGDRGEGSGLDVQSPPGRHGVDQGNGFGGIIGRE